MSAGPLLDRLAGIEPESWLLLLIAPFIGSFLGVIIRRLPEKLPVLRGRSRCEHCGTALTPFDLLPFLGWMRARGRCRHCGSSLGWFYPGVELAALVIAAVAIAVDDPARAWLDCLLGWPLLALGWIDLRRWLLPDALTLPLLAIGLAVAAALDPEDLGDRALASVLGYAALRAVAWLYLRLRRREGLGAGDAKLLAASGAWLGSIALPQVILFAAAGALIAAGFLTFAGTRLSAHSALPFGPFLALATWLIWMFGPITL